MDKNFDVESAKKFLANGDLQLKNQREEDRVNTLNKVIENLKTLFGVSNIEVYLVGSIIQPYMFHSNSDVDIVLKNFEGDRFDIWTKLENVLGRNVEIIIFESSSFQEHVLKHGLKVF